MTDVIAVAPLFMLADSDIDKKHKFLGGDNGFLG